MDFNDDDTVSPTEFGWFAATQAGATDLGGTGIGVSVEAVGVGVFVDDRLRTGVAWGLEPDMWTDFIFANGSDNTGEGLNVRITGLLPSRTYPVTLWMFDKSSTGVRTSQWNGVMFEFNGSFAAPQSRSDSALNLDVTTDALGTLTLRGRAVFTGAPHNVFLNGLQVDAPRP